MDNVVRTSIQVLIPPDAGKRETPAAAGMAGATHRCARTRWRLRRRALPKTQGDGRAGVRSNQAQPAHQPVSAARQIRRTLRMAADHRHAQPTEAPQAPPGRPGGLKGPARQRRSTWRAEAGLSETRAHATGTGPPPPATLSDTHNNKDLRAQPVGSRSLRRRQRKHVVGTPRSLRQPPPTATTATLTRSHSRDRGPARAVLGTRA